MSRIGRKSIPVPAGVDITIDGQTVKVKGPKGELSHTLAEPITVERDADGTLNVNRPNDERKAKEADKQAAQWEEWLTTAQGAVDG